MARICLVSPHARHDRVFLEAEAIRELGHDVTLILRTTDPHRPTEEAYRGFDVRWVHYGERHAPRLDGVSFARHAERIATTLRPDTVHAHGLLALQAALRVARTTRARIVYEAGANRSALSPTLRRLEDAVIRSAAAVIAPNEDVVEALRRRNPSRTVWLVPDRTGRPQRSVTLARRIGAAPDDLLIALPYTAPFSAPGLRALIDVLPRLPRQTRVAVLGHGAASGQLPPDVGRHERVHLVWHDSWNGAVADAAGAHVGCVLDVAIEDVAPPVDPAVNCMSARLPLITSNRPEFAGLVTRHAFGEPVDPLDRAALQRTIEPYLFNPAVRQRARAAASTAASQLDADRLRRRLVACYAHAIGRPAVPSSPETTAAL